MANLASGILLWCAIIGMALWYRPKTKDSLKICGIGLFMGLLSVLMRDGITGLQMVEHMMQLFVLAACFMRLRQEKRQREVRKAARRARVRQMQLQKREKAPGICA